MGYNFIDRYDTHYADGEVSTDTVFDLLASRRRQLAIACLSRHDRPISLADLADEVAVRERDGPLPAGDKDDAFQVYVSLYHIHVPKLADAGVVEYERERNLIGLAENADRIADDVVGHLDAGDE